MNNSIDPINQDAAKACAKPIPEPAGYNFNNWYEERGPMSEKEQRAMDLFFDKKLKSNLVHLQQTTGEELSNIEGERYNVLDSIAGENREQPNMSPTGESENDL